MRAPLYIFDLDGTLADIEHRKHHIERPACPFCAAVGKCFHDTPLQERDEARFCGQYARELREPFAPDWRSFFAACANDQPVPAAIRTLQALRKGGAECWIWTGRSDEVREQTMVWLLKHGCMTRTFRLGWLDAPESILMRKAGDYRPDHELKLEWLAALEPPERDRLTAVFEDRARVVAMWREYGVPCFQVAPGEF